jgi:glutathione-independent formaldehyde dehydrogenase
VVHDPGAPNDDSKQGILKVRFGKGWSKSLHFHTGQAPVLQYNRQLMQAILHDRLPIAKIVNATVISLDDAPKGYQDFDKGAAKKFVIDPHGIVAKKAA